MNPSERQFVGEWRQVEPDPHPASIPIAFESEGRLRYTIETGTIQHILLTWRIEGGSLITDQPSAQREERTQFRFEGSSRLVLERLGERFCFECIRM